WRPDRADPCSSRGRATRTPSLERDAKEIQRMSLVDSMQTPTRTSPPGPPPAENMVWIPGGTFRMGSDDHYPEEAPAPKVTVGGFWRSRYTVTNADFNRFVEATGYVTFAERPANAADYPDAEPEMLVPSSVIFKKASGPVDLRNHYNWWVYVPGADW